MKGTKVAYEQLPFSFCQVVQDNHEVKIRLDWMEPGQRCTKDELFSLFEQIADCYENMMFVQVEMPAKVEWANGSGIELVVDVP